MTSTRLNARRSGGCALLSIALLAFCALAAQMPPPAAAAGTKPPSYSLLFVQTAGNGEIYRDLRGRLVLALRVSRWTQTFSDRPERKAGTEPTRAFVGNWARRGFRADPPNAALTIDRASGKEATVELSHPRFRDGRLLYRIRPIGKEASRAVKPGRFGSAALFIDNAAQEWCYRYFDQGEELGSEKFPCEAVSTATAMPVIVELPATFGEFELKIDSDVASFSQRQSTLGAQEITWNSPFSLTFTPTIAIGRVQYQPVMIQGAGGPFELTATIPLRTSPDSYTYSPIGPGTSITYTLPKRTG